MLKLDNSTTIRYHAHTLQFVQKGSQHWRGQVRMHLQKLGFTHTIVACTDQTNNLDEKKLKSCIKCILMKTAYLFEIASYLFFTLNKSIFSHPAAFMEYTSFISSLSLSAVRVSCTALSTSL